MEGFGMQHCIYLDEESWRGCSAEIASWLPFAMRHALCVCDPGGRWGGGQMPAAWRKSKVLLLNRGEGGWHHSQNASICVSVLLCGRCLLFHIRIFKCTISCFTFLCYQCCGSGIRCFFCFFDPWIRIRVRDREKNPDRGSGMNIPDNIYESLDTVFWANTVCHHWFFLVLLFFSPFVR